MKLKSFSRATDTVKIQNGTLHYGFQSMGNDVPQDPDVALLGVYQMMLHTITKILTKPCSLLFYL